MSWLQNARESYRWLPEARHVSKQLRCQWAHTAPPVATLHPALTCTGDSWRSLNTSERLLGTLRSTGAALAAAPPGAGASSR